MHIYHVISGDLWAGAEVMACHLLKFLHRMKVPEISVILLNEGRLADELRSAGLRISVIDEKKHSFLKISREVRKVLSNCSHPHCIVHAHRAKENIIAWWASRGLPVRCRLVSTQHGLPESHHLRKTSITNVKVAVNFFLLKHYFSKLVSVSRDIRKVFVTELAFPSYQIEVIHNGIVIPPEMTFHQRDESFTIGSSGRLFPVKDYPLMAKISICLKDNKRIKFTLAGEGPERTRLMNMIKAEQLQDVFTLEGHLDDMGPFYRKLDLYLNTSIHEGIPLTILEAMAHGVPVVAPKVGGIPEVVEDGVEGFLISGREAEGFAEKCLLLAQNMEMRMRMSAAARKKAVEGFSIERMAEQYMNVYADVLHDRRN